MKDFIVNGYAYPTISDESLNWWLPRLRWLSTFSYGFKGDGSLIQLNDERLCNRANELGVRPIMVLTPLDEDGRFNDYVAIEVLKSSRAQERLIDRIEENIQKKNMAGIDFDFEYLDKDYAASYVELVDKTAQRLRPKGYYTNVALAPKTSTNQEGLLYQGHDYSGMGAVADYCLLMTYEWGYTYGEPMAVSPINNVRRVIEYGVSQIPPEKILMGMNNYGYDWLLPYVKGVTKAEKVENYQALGRAQYYNVSPNYDEGAQAPFYSYSDPMGNEHIVWYENEESWKKRLGLVEEYNLAGISIWNIMKVFYGGI